MIPKAWCPACRQEIRVVDVVGGRCPWCGVDLAWVLVARSVYREIVALKGVR